MRHTLMLHDFHSMQKNKDSKDSAPGLKGTISTVLATQKCRKKPYSSNHEVPEPEVSRKSTLPREQQSPLPVEQVPKAGDHTKELRIYSSRTQTESCQEKKRAETVCLMERNHVLECDSSWAQDKELKTLEEATQGYSRASFIANTQSPE